MYFDYWKGLKRGLVLSTHYTEGFEGNSDPEDLEL